MKINEEDTNKLKSYLPFLASMSSYYHKAQSFIQNKEYELLSPGGFLREISAFTGFFEGTDPDKKFRRYIREETHYHLERQAWMWSGGTFSNNFEDCKFTKDNKVMSEAEYQIERDRVLMAFTLSYVNRVKEGHGSPAHFIELERDLKSLEQLNSTN